MSEKKLYKGRARGVEHCKHFIRVFAESDLQRRKEIAKANYNWDLYFDSLVETTELHLRVLLGPSAATLAKIEGYAKEVVAALRLEHKGEDHETLPSQG